MQLLFHLGLAPRAVTTTIVTSLWSAITVILIAIRLYGYSIGVLRLRWDFFFVVFGTIIGLVTVGLSIAAFEAGIGWHLADITYPELFACLVYFWIALPLGLVGTCVAKLAIVALLLQVTTILQPKRRIFLYTVGAINTVMALSQVIVTLTQCDPYPYLWARYLPGSCPRAEFAVRYSYFQGSVTALTDIILALYPVSIAWSLTVSLKTKIGFCSLMAGGLLCVISPIQRSRYVQGLVAPVDITYELPPIYIWCTIELWLILIIASIPPLRPLFLYWFWDESNKHRDLPGLSQMQLATIEILPEEIAESEKANEAKSVAAVYHASECAV